MAALTAERTLHYLYVLLCQLKLKDDRDIKGVILKILFKREQGQPDVKIIFQLKPRSNDDYVSYISRLRSHGRRSPGGCIPPSVCQIFAKLPFLPQILAFLCLQPPHVPVSPHTFKFTPPSMDLIDVRLQGEVEIF